MAGIFDETRRSFAAGQFLFLARKLPTYISTKKGGYYE